MKFYSYLRKKYLKAKNDTTCLKYIWFGVLFPTVVSAMQEEVLITEIDVKNDRTRGLDNESPDYIELAIQRNGGANVHLKLLENKKIDVNAPVYHSVTEKGKSKTLKKEVRRIEGVRFYYDKAARAALMVTCVDTQKGACAKRVEGSLNIDGDFFDIKPSSDTIVTRSLDVPAVRHILERSDSKRLYGDEETTTDYKGDNIKHGKAYRKVKERILHGTERQKRQTAGKTQYAIEVIGVTDPTLWTYMENRIKPREGMSKDESIEYEIRQRIAHIVHGVSMNYEDIDDKEFSIYVTVSGFLIMKKLDATSPMAKYLKFTPEEGYPSVIVDRGGYLDAVIDDVTNRGIPNDDHYMVFTLADLDKSAIGITYPSHCCYEKRVSVNEYDARFYSIIVVASHELGHNLGAEHDHTVGCPNYYIMYSGPTYLNRGDEEGTKHPWSFSTCSINAFREFLKQWGKKCLLDHADIYDKMEWESHISLLPGERYTADQQCKLIYGDFSYMCRKEIPPTDLQFCQQMSCLDDNNRCYVQNAARGTQCGFPSSNSHCYKGKCVKKEGASEPLIKTGDSENCYNIFSEGYQGTRSVTKSGIECQSWSIQDPHRHVLGKPEHFLDDSVVDASNYCRDPDGTGTPWCYLSKTWEFCDIPKCSTEMETQCAQKVLEYQYNLSKTKSGYTCQRWDSQDPQSHRYTNVKDFPDQTLSDAANFCRNPDGSQHAWCYTTSSEARWEFCDTNTEMCTSDACYSDHVVYAGKTNLTKSNVKCQMWDKDDPHANSFDGRPELFPEKSVAAVGNSCRDPSQTGQHWCYLGITWESCEIPLCT